MEKGYVFVPYIMDEKITIIDSPSLNELYLKMKVKDRNKKIKKIMDKINDR